jgi:predicted secreted protein
MNRSQKILIISHCAMNANAKVPPLASIGGVFTAPISEYIQSGCGLMQLPCPEVTYLGMNRWGMTKEQYDHPNFRRHCREILEYPIVQIQAYVQAGYDIVGVLGMDKSPNCGLNLTCRGYRGGELGSFDQVAQITNDLRFVPEKGVFMEEFLELLDTTVHIRPKLFAIEESSPTSTQE